MNPVPIDIDRLTDDRLIHHITTGDTRRAGGFRLALEVLGIPIPDYAKRKPAGRPSIVKLMNAADKDSGTIKTYHDEKRKVGFFAPLNKSL